MRPDHRLRTIALGRIIIRKQLKFRSSAKKERVERTLDEARIERRRFPMERRVEMTFNYTMGRGRSPPTETIRRG